MIKASVISNIYIDKVLGIIIWMLIVVYHTN